MDDREHSVQYFLDLIKKSHQGQIQGLYRYDSRCGKVISYASGGA